MIQIHHTPHFAGIQISGDYFDFGELSNAIQQISQSRKADDGYAQSSKRLLAMSTMLRGAQLGTLELPEKPTVINAAQSFYMPINTTKYVLYLRVNVLWPEALFTALVLNELIVHFRDNEDVHSWDPSVSAVRSFQSALASCLSKTLSPSRYRQLRKCIDPHGMSAKSKYQNYLVQYIDRLNIQFLKLPPTRRRDSISHFAIRICELDSLYYTFRSDFIDLAETLQVHVSDLKYKEDYPTGFEW